MLTVIGPHPNPAKAADGKKLHALAIDHAAADVIRRIFGEFLAGHGLYAIAEHLTRDGIACPSAHDPERNSHRCGVAWSKYAIRAILTNPRYTGRQVWNKQRKDEVLIDVHDVALGHTTRQRRNDADKWIYFEQLAHPPIVDDTAFVKAQDLLTARRGVHGPHKPHRSRHHYVVSGLLFCGSCDRRMQGHWANSAAYYQCRFPAEYAIANHVAHPLNVTLRQDALLRPLDTWLSSKFGPHYLPGTIDELLAASVHDIEPQAMDREIASKIAECDRKLVQYRAALDAGAEPASLVRWITETETERAAHQALRRAAPQRPNSRMTKDHLAKIVEDLADLIAVVRDADPDDKAEIYTRLGLRLTYQPQNRTIRAEAHISADSHWHFDGVRGGLVSYVHGPSDTDTNCCQALDEQRVACDLR